MICSRYVYVCVSSKEHGREPGMVRNCLIHTKFYFARYAKTLYRGIMNTITSFSIVVFRAVKYRSSTWLNFLLWEYRISDHNYQYQQRNSQPTVIVTKIKVQRIDLSGVLAVSSRKALNTIGD